LGGSVGGFVVRKDEVLEMFGIVLPDLRRDSPKEIRELCAGPILGGRRGVDYHPTRLGSFFLKSLDSERKSPITLIIKSHLFLESMLDHVIKKKLPHSSLILDRHDFTFSFRIDLLRVLNLIDAIVFNDLKSLNSLRNKYAHDLAYDIALFDVTKFHYCKYFSDLFRKCPEDLKRPLNCLALRLVLYYLFSHLDQRHPYLAELQYPGKTAANVTWPPNKSLKPTNPATGDGRTRERG
jgi:hypothetical protein